MKYSLLFLFVCMSAFAEAENHTECYQEKDSSYRRTLITTDGKFFFEETEYLFRDCKGPLYSETISGYFYENESSYLTTIETVTVKPLAIDYATLMNSDEDCGLNNWEVGVATSVDRLNCYGLPVIGEVIEVIKTKP